MFFGDQFCVRHVLVYCIKYLDQTPYDPGLAVPSKTGAEHASSIFNLRERCTNTRDVVAIVAGHTSTPGLGKRVVEPHHVAVLAVGRGPFLLHTVDLDLGLDVVVLFVVAGAVEKEPYEDLAGAGDFGRVAGCGTHGGDALHHFFLACQTARPAFRLRYVGIQGSISLRQSDGHCFSSFGMVLHTGSEGTSKVQ
ncbi:hypothetical protein D3C85_1106030 [compost metagenome]